MLIKHDWFFIYNIYCVHTDLNIFKQMKYEFQHHKKGGQNYSMSLKFGTGHFNLASAKFRWLNPTNSKFLMLSYCWQTLKYFFRWYRPNNILQASALQTRQTEIGISQLTYICIRNYFIQSLTGLYLLIVSSWYQNISAHVKHVHWCQEYFELSSRSGCNY